MASTMRPATSSVRRMLATSKPCQSASRLILLRSLNTTARRFNDSSSQSELGVGELQGAKFRIEPLRRVGEDDNTKRARLIYQSRKRGILESDLLLSTFAATYLPTMTTEELTQYDLFLDENDWDIYYWATQKEPSSSTNPSTTESPASASSSSTHTDTKTGSDDALPRNPPKGEWAQTIGTFKPAYRPVPERWRDSAVLEKLRAHVRNRSVDGGEGNGMAFMPPLDTK